MTQKPRCSTFPQGLHRDVGACVVPHWENLHPYFVALVSRGTEVKVREYEGATYK